MTSSALTGLAALAAPPFFAELALLLVASAAMAYVCHRLKVTPIVSFLVTGALIGPYALGWIRDRALIEAAADVGVVLLLFSIGIELSLGKLARIQRLIFVGGGLQVVLVTGVTTGVLALLGVDWRAGLFTGCLVALSSTAIVLKLLMSRSETDTPGGQAALGILIFQDLAVVAMVLVVPMLGGEGGSAAGVAWAFAKAGAIVATVLVVARRVMPPVLEAVARTCSQEIFVLAVMAICFGTAWLTSLAGVSLSLGAFLAGLVVSESRFSELAVGEIKPLQILFSATFFVSVGLLLDLSFLVQNLALVLVVVAAVLAIKVAGAAASLRLLGYGAGTTLFASLLIAQVGEFSFVLERSGREMGLFPGGLAKVGSQAFLAATVLLMIATPLLASLGRRFQGRPRPLTAGAPAAEMPATPPGEGVATAPLLADHVLVAGFGASGRALADALARQGVPVLVLTLSPEGAREAEGMGLPVLRGNYLRQHELSQAGIGRARLLVVADDDPETTRRVVRSVQAIHPGLPIVARTERWSEAPGLYGAGAVEVVADEWEGTVGLVEAVLRQLEVDPESVREHRDALRAATAAGPATEGEEVRLTPGQRGNARCSHTALARAVRVTAHECPECVAVGDSWEHLRVCMTCGHVGCCDESKNRHATRHFHTADHPIIKSLEPGEDWAWCYRDEAML